MFLLGPKCGARRTPPSQMGAGGGGGGGDYSLSLSPSLSLSLSLSLSDLQQNYINHKPDRCHYITQQTCMLVTLSAANCSYYDRCYIITLLKLYMKLWFS